MFQGSRVALFAGLIISQGLLQDIINQLGKPNNFYGDVAPLVARMQAEANSQPPAQQPMQPPQAPQVPPPIPDKKSP